MRALCFRGLAGSNKGHQGRQRGVGSGESRTKTSLEGNETSQAEGAGPGESGIEQLKPKQKDGDDDDAQTSSSQRYIGEKMSERDRCALRTLHVFNPLMHIISSEFKVESSHCT